MNDVPYILVNLIIINIITIPKNNYIYYFSYSLLYIKFTEKSSNIKHFQICMTFLVLNLNVHRSLWLPH